MDKLDIEMKSRELMNMGIGFQPALEMMAEWVLSQDWDIYLVHTDDMREVVCFRTEKEAKAFRDDSMVLFGQSNIKITWRRFKSYNKGKEAENGADSRTHQ